MNCNKECAVCSECFLAHKPAKWMSSWHPLFCFKLLSN
nr:MAG TPA: hypothetical protein [Caudoviricetes sp.]